MTCTRLYLSRPKKMHNSISPSSMYLIGKQSVKRTLILLMRVHFILEELIIQSIGVLGMPPTVGTVAPSFGNIDTCPLETEASSFRFLGQLPRNCSLSDLTAEFSQSSEILENHLRSPFLSTDVGQFLNSQEENVKEIIGTLKVSATLSSAEIKQILLLTDDLLRTERN